MTTLSAIRSQALQLPPAEREELAQELIDSLDSEPSDSPLTVDAAYEEELQRRIASVEDGTAKMTDGDAFLAELRGRSKGSDKA